MTTLRIDRIGQNAEVRAERPRIEIELLLRCASTSLDTKAFERTECLLHREIDWAYLIETALRHGVMPLLYRNLRTHFRESVPGAAMDRLQAHSNAIGLRSLFLTQELLRILNLLDAHDIPAIPYKGPVLAVSVYGDLSFRQFGDLDILVSQQHARKAKEILISEGYSLLDTPPKTQGTTRLDSGREYKLGRQDGKAFVEIQWLIAAHWQLPHSFPLNPEELWERSERVPLAGVKVRSLSQEDVLLVLCVHGVNHHWARLMWICDIAELIRARPALDWGQVFHLAKKSGSKRMLLLGLCLANELLGTALPKEATRRIEADPNVELLALQVWQWLFRDQDKGLDLFEEFAFFIRVRERAQDRIPYYRLYLKVFLRTAITPNENDRALFRLPDSLSPLYYILRPLRLMSTIGLNLLKRPLWSRDRGKVGRTTEVG